MRRTTLWKIATLLIGVSWSASSNTLRGDELPVEYGHYPAPAYQRHGPGFGYQQPFTLDPPVSTTIPKPAARGGNGASPAVAPVPVVPVMPAPVWGRGVWFERPYPYHFDYYRQRYGGAAAPQPANIYSPPTLYAPGYYAPLPRPYGYPGGFY